MRAFAIAAAFAVAAGVAGQAAADSNTIPVSVTIPRSIYLWDNVVISITTAPHASCVGTVLLPTIIGVAGQSSTGWKVPKVADDQGHLSVTATAAGLRGPRQIIVTCTADGKKGVGHAYYYVQ